MCPLPSRASSDRRSNGKGQNRNSGTSLTEEFSGLKPEQIIRIANSKVKLFTILKQYSIDINRTSAQKEWSEHIICPFPSHKGGNERSASFGYNFIDDRFYCLGCTASGKAVEFIAFKEQLNRLVVANQIIQEYGGYEVSDSDVIDDENPKIESALFSLSGMLQNLYQKHKNNTNIIKDIEKIIWWFDGYLYAKVPKRKIDVDELKQRVDKAIELLEKYN